MGLGDGLKHIRKQCLRRLQRCCGRLREVVFNPDYWYAYCSQKMSQWVTQKVVVSYCVFEMCVCCALIGPVKVIPEILMSGRVMPRKSITPTIATIHLVVRAVSGLLGAFAAMFRKVGRTKLYFGLLLMNLLISAAMIEPLFSCKCSCKSRGPHDNRKCESLEHFRNWAWWFAKTGKERGRRLLDIPEASASNFDDSVVQFKRPITIEDVDMDSFQVLPLGLEYHGPPSYWNCTETDLEPAKVYETRQMQFKLDRLAKGPTERLEKEDVTNGPELALLSDTLEVCAADRECQLVELQVNVNTDPVGSDNITNGSLRVCRWWSWNRTYPSLLKVLPGCVCKDRCPEDGCSNLLPPKVILDECTNSCSTTETFIQPGHYWAQPKQASTAVGELASFFCRMTVFSMLVVLIGLDAMGVIMVFVVYAFMRNRCGDVFFSEDEWAVRDSTSFATTCENWEDDDDFQAVDISRLPSGSREDGRTSVDSRQEASSNRSMLGSMMGGHGSNASSNVEMQRM